MSEEEDDDSRMSNGEQPIKPNIDSDMLARLKQVYSPGWHIMYLCSTATIKLARQLFGTC